MRKILTFLLVIILLTGTAYALYCEQANFPVFVNGEQLNLTDPPLAYNGRSYLPVKAISDAVGVNAEWKNNRVEISTLDLEKLKDSCVMVRAGDVKGTYNEQGSGVIIDYDEILTVNHVADHPYYAIHYDDSDSFVHCSVSDTAEAQDAATLKPEKMNVKPVQIGDSDDVKVGDKVWVISCPEGEKNVVSSGTVKNVSYFTNNIYGISIDPVTRGGSSGGAAFNSRGELIGIVQAGDNDITFIIPINDIRESLAA